MYTIFTHPFLSLLVSTHLYASNTRLKSTGLLTSQSRYMDHDISPLKVLYTCDGVGGRSSVPITIRWQVPISNLGGQQKKINHEKFPETYKKWLKNKSVRFVGVMGK